MKRVGAVLLFLLLALAFFLGVAYGIHQKRAAEAAEAEQILRKEMTLQVYTDMPKGMLEMIFPAFTEETGLYPEVHYMTDSEWDVWERGRDNPADLVIASEPLLQKGKERGWTLAYTSEKTDTALELFKDKDSSWTGLWIDPFVFAINEDFFQERGGEGYTWEEVLTDSRIRLSVTDFTTAAMAGDFLLMLTEHYGEEKAFDLLRTAQGQTVQYGKYLSTPAHMAAMGKCDVGISGRNEAVRTQKEGLPLRIVYPTGGTSWYLYGVALVDNDRDTTKAEALMNWLLSPKKYKKIMEAEGFYYFHVNDEEIHADAFGEEISYWNLEKRYTREGKKQLLNRWIEEIRFGEDKGA